MLLARVHLGRWFRGKADPEDLVQEAFLAAVAAVADFRGDTDPQLLGRLLAILMSRVLELVDRFGAAARDIRRERPDRLTPPDGSTRRWSVAAGQSTPIRTAQRREAAEWVALGGPDRPHRDAP